MENKKEKGEEKKRVHFVLFYSSNINFRIYNYTNDHNK